LNAIAAARPHVVGFTSVFQQNVASLALARRLRGRLPHATIVVGGANCEGTMGAQMLESFPWIDAVVDGEGADAFAALLRRVARGGPLASEGNLRTRIVRKPNSHPQPSAATHVRERLARPEIELDYSDYFDQRKDKFPNESIVPIHLPFETSRGCW